MRRDTKLKIGRWITGWQRKGYPDGLPDEAPETLEALGRVPSYRLLCVALLKNDETLETLGFSRPPCRLYNELKREEIRLRGGRVSPPQLRLF